MSVGEVDVCMVYYPGAHVTGRRKEVAFVLMLPTSAKCIFFCQHSVLETAAPPIPGVSAHSVSDLAVN